MVNNDEDLVVEEEILDNVEENETPEIDPEVSEDEVDVEEPENDQDDVDGEEESEEDRVVTIGEPEADTTSEEEHQKAPKWVSKVRKLNRTLESENKKLKRQLEQVNKPKDQPVTLGEEPTIASCGYDDVKYKHEILAYEGRKRKIEDQQVQQKKVIEEQQQKVQAKVTRYADLKKEHGFKDYSDAEGIVENTMDIRQQQIILQGAEDSALVVYALGKNPKKLEELSNIKDPVEFAFKIAKLESQLKVTNRKATTKPEKKVSKGKAGGMSGNSDKTLERLREEAAKTGNYTKVTAYKRKLRG